MSFLDKIFGSGIKETVGGLADIADKFIRTSEEKDEFKLKVAEFEAAQKQKLVDSAQAEVEAYLKDVDSARESNTRIQEAEKASWLSKNVGYILDLLVAALWIGMTAYIGVRALKLIEINESAPDMTVVLGIYAAVTGQFSQVISYHRGSSIGSANKEKVISKYMQGQ